MNPIHGTLASLEWENRFFDVNSCVVHFSEEAPALQEEQLNTWSRVQAKIPSHRTDWLDGLQQLGFQLVEGEVDLVLSVGTQNADITVDIAQPNDIPSLRQSASQVFTQSRFRTPWYKAGDSGRFYAQWIENAVLGTFDHQCLLLRNGDELPGFVTLRQLNDAEARIGLLAGRGLGEELMAAAQDWCRQRGLQTLRVATQVSNTAALRRYIKSGATIESTAFWLYR
ncbi:dTDP-4-amino-4,6-dideoxy-D-galactose acyltransferase [Enterobacter sp. Cy-643]|uniref:dTDP-4-amino-4,6-dideoxy-D-galactose acyltransferase n=1 Tax=Enterobacter sp. Cy-643 TaxID=2608346 RepID=UPI00142121CA|nr:dTDP-4-amino-4,6-dideoxy-D-galactose acyltransferase [Enterobacter sp. Cy-643]NIF34746.1 dTDP-4-amino-4,6-dideoxy-D-galactose acyltransferase [Enterobacter sp. Cy-643]